MGLFRIFLSIQFPPIQHRYCSIQFINGTKNGQGARSSIHGRWRMRPKRETVYLTISLLQVEAVLNEEAIQRLNAIEPLRRHSRDRTSASRDRISGVRPSALSRIFFF